MKRSDRINTIKKVKAISEKEAVSKLTQAIVALNEIQSRYQELIKYRREYQDNLLHAGRQGIAASRVQGFQRFLESLNQAVDEQAKRVSQQEKRVEDLKKEWHIQRKALTGVENWMDKVIQQERKHEDLKEQKELDDLANRTRIRRQQ